MSEILFLNISGPDHPGITASFTQALARHSVNILDIDQAVTHDFLSLGMSLEIPDGESATPILKELEALAAQQGVRIWSTPIRIDDYEQWVAQQGQPRYIVTLLGRKLSAANIAHVAEVAARYGVNIDMLRRLSGRFPLAQKEDGQDSLRACVAFSLRGRVEDPESLRNDLLAITREDEVDLSFQEDNLYRRHRRLIVFDMDSTLIQCEVIDELARRAGVGDEVSAITEAAMRGEIGFDESFRRRLSTLKGLDESVLAEIAETLPITEGADRLINTLKKLGYRIGILSGGFTYFANHLKERWGLDCVSANELDIVDGKLTGEVKGDIINGEKKAELFQKMAGHIGVPMEQTIAVGDGANDLPMLRIAGLGVAFHAKPLVRERARHAISTLGLDSILYLLGVNDQETTH
jgi:phosphoserine phosphatase